MSVLVQWMTRGPWRRTLRRLACPVAHELGRHVGPFLGRTLGTGAHSHCGADQGGLGGTTGEGRGQACLCGRGEHGSEMSQLRRNAWAHGAASAPSHCEMLREGKTCWMENPAQDNRRNGWCGATMRRGAASGQGGPTPLLHCGTIRGGCGCYVGGDRRARGGVGTPLCTCCEGRPGRRRVQSRMKGRGRWYYNQTQWWQRVTC